MKENYCNYKVNKSAIFHGVRKNVQKILNAMLSFNDRNLKKMV